MKKLMLIIATATCCAMTTGCATEYYPPQGENDFTKIDGKVRGPVKREGFISWSSGIGKSFLNPSFSLVGK